MNGCIKFIEKACSIVSRFSKDEEECQNKRNVKISKLVKPNGIRFKGITNFDLRYCFC